MYLRPGEKFESNHLGGYGSAYKDRSAQYLAIKHNRASDFTHSMTTQDKVFIIPFDSS